MAQIETEYFGPLTYLEESVFDFPAGNYYPILINRDGSGNLFVLDCECRHQSCVVPPFDMTSFNIQCPCHGSEYWIDGSVIQGPTTMALGSYPFEFDGNDTLTIHIPCWAFCGDQDGGIEKNRAMVKALKEAGGNPRYTELPFVGHNSWDCAYVTPELYTWFLKHSLSQSTTK